MWPQVVEICSGFCSSASKAFRSCFALRGGHFFGCSGFFMTAQACTGFLAGTGHGRFKAGAGIAGAGFLVFCVFGTRSFLAR